ncbi:uncharacterized protein LOC105181247 [Harpegnathos saltator]|uniref:Uncharacterized protein n=1 Tax=Harpegnathos saltator TaxID=610380 RepID=E2B3A8_HARSA|nr:uncharacterized protein LOC105181247 [Harpegnathos saltator]EFN89786.1 hypothetical protein EAI_13973 [Harpegnathos saltator]
MANFKTLRPLASVYSFGLLMHFHWTLTTDYFNGQADLIGPRPRIPDAEQLKKELLFAEECRKHMFPPKERLVKVN